MTDPTDDAERIAALLDGRLGARERAEVLARLGESDAAFEAFVDAAAVLRESPEESVRPLTRPQRWRAPLLALAASLVIGAILVPFLRSRSSAFDGADPAQLSATLWASHDGLPPRWNGTPWTATRGSSESVARQAQPARLGARLLDLELAIDARDSTSSSIAREIASLVKRLPASAPLVVIYDRIGTTTDAREQAALLARVRETTIARGGRDIVELAAWTEALRIATRWRDTIRFRLIAQPRMIARAKLVLKEGLDPDASLAAVISANISAAPIDWDACETELTSLLATLGR